jgi:hypothetical protein
MNAPEKPKPAPYDRTSEDVGNLVHLEHFNVFHNDQQKATLFYVVGLGGTRDPYLMVGLTNMWVNFGRTQAHLPSPQREATVPQVMRGTMGLVVPSLEELRSRLERIEADLTNTKFTWKETKDGIEATCPWGNRFRCHAPSKAFGDTQLGLMYIDFDVPPGTAEGIARFYTEVMKAPSAAKGGRADVPVGRHQHLYFTETPKPLPEYDHHHFQVYIADFSSPYRWLLERGLITLETDAHEWRLQWIVDPQDGRKLFQIEHEVRSMKHPLFNRPFVNRNVHVTNTAYVPNGDAFRGVF